jgi:ribosomal subunit interface protein
MMRQTQERSKEHPMEAPLQIVVRNISHSAALEARVRENVAKLEAFHPRIMSCRVTVEELQKRRRQGRHFRVSIDIRVPGREIVASHDHDEDVYVALRDAFHSARRQLEDTARVMRGEVKVHETGELNEPDRKERT